MLDITTDFGGIVEPLIQGSILERWVNPTNPMDTLTVVDAIETNQIDFYVEQMGFCPDYGLEAIDSLIHLHEELNKFDLDREEIELYIEVIANML
ncbi:MAG: hypothetical protein HGA33_03840 [Candidatus Moranbacteria bacterium]|nr:hypothetical protein [Candidatus Moranbacteria bacterium]